MVMGGLSHDVFAAGIYYHKSCHLKFSFNYAAKKEEYDDDNQSTALDLVNEFLGDIRLNVFRQKNAYLLTELMHDIMNMNEEHSIDPTTRHTHVLKEKIRNEFPDSIGFYKTMHQVIVFSSDMNPLDYTVATVKGHGMRDDDLIKACAKLINKSWNMKREQEHFSRPHTPEEVIEKLNNGPLQELYNLIYATIGPRCKTNEYWYAITSSRPRATKILPQIRSH